MAVTYTVPGADYPNGMMLTLNDEQSSNVPHPTFATSGDVVTETFSIFPSLDQGDVSVTYFSINGVDVTANVVSLGSNNADPVASLFSVSYTVAPGDNNNTADISISAADTNGGSLSFNTAGTITVDTHVPTTTQGGEASSNPTATLAKAGDIITETFSASDTVTGVTIDGHSATVTPQGGDSYQATYTVQAADLNVPADVVVTQQDAAGLSTATTIPGSVTVDTVAPQIFTFPSEWWSASADPSLAKVGDLIFGKVYVDPSSPGIVTGVTVDGHDALVQPEHHSALTDTYDVIYTVASGDSNGPVNVVVTAIDPTGNVGTTSFVEAGITINTTAPTVGQVSESSNNATHTLAKAGDTITETFTASDTITGVTIGGHSVTPLHNMDGSYTASYTVQAGDTGAATFTVAQVNAVGNTSTLNVGGAVTIDTQAPTVAITSAGGFTNQAVHSITGTGEAGTTVTILDGATNVGTATVSAGGTWSSPVTLNGLGPHNFTASDVDAAGNVGTSAVDTITLAHPVAITSPIEVVNNPNQTISGTGEAGATVTVFDGATSLGSTTVLGNGTWTDAVTFTNVQGSKTIAAVESDGLGNTLSTDTGTYGLDTVAPVVQLTSEASGNATSTLAKAGDVITETFTASDVGFGIATTVATIDGQTATVVHGLGNNYTATYTVLPGDTNGTAGVSVTSTDAAGNVTTVTDLGSVTVDTVAPTVTLVGEASNNATTTLAKAGDVITETFTSTDPVTGATIDGNAATVHHGAGNNYTATYSVQSGDTNGTADLSITARDAAGNSTTVTATGSVTVDTLAPTGTITTPGGFTNDPSPAVAGTGEAGATVTLMDGATILGTTTVDSHGDWVLLRNTFLLSQIGKNRQLTAHFTDDAGNVGTSNAISFTLADPVTITSSGSLTNQQHQTITGTGEAGTAVTLFDGATVLDSTTVLGNGTWSDSVTLTNAQGAHAISAVESGSGNTLSTSDPVTYTVDTLAPTVTEVTESSNNATHTLAKAGDVITETFTATDTVSGVTIDGVAATVHHGVGNNYTATYTVQAGDTGLAGVSITATDAAGNVTTTPVVGTVTIDTDAPVITLAGEASSNATTTLAKAGDVITETFTSTDSVTGVTIDGQAAAVVHGLGNNYTATYTVLSGDANGAAGVSVTSTDAAGNVTTVTDLGSVTVDTVSPTVTLVGEASNNATTTLAKAGDVITETFTSTDSVTGVTIDGQAAAVVHGLGNNYTATYTVLLGDANGAAGVSVTSTDAVGNTTMVTDLGSVTVDTVSPTVTLVGEASNNATTTLAKAGDVITETFTSTDTVTGVTIDGNAATVHHGAGNNYTATYTVLSGDANGAAGVEVTSQDAAGNVTTVTDGGSVVVDTVAPTVVIGSEASSNGNSAQATVGDVITETFTSTDPVTAVTIDGHAATVHTLGGNNYSATYTVHAGDGNGLAGISITSTDAAGNVTTVTNPGSVTVDTVAPVVAAIGEASNNATTTLAKAGDVITETITSTDPVTSVLIDGNAATVHHGAGNNYTATYTVQSGDTNGAAGVSITATDAAGNATTVTAAGTVTVDTVAPVVHLTSEVSNNATTTLAKAGDVITETFTSTDTVTGVTIDGNAATVHHGAGNNYTATYTVLTNDPNGAAGVVVTSHDTAGNVTIASDGGSVVVDTIAPAVVDGGEASNNHNSTALAKPGDVITETFTATSTDTVDGVVIDGQTATVHALGGGNYTATYTVLSGDPSGLAGVVISAHDAAGNVTVDTIAGSVTVASTLPTAFGIAEQSNNVLDITMATTGDAIGGNFSVASATPGVGVTIDSATIDGQAVTPFVADPVGLGPNVYGFERTTLVTDPGGLADVVVHLHDDAGNTNVITFGGAVTVDTLPPTITQVSDASNNPHPTWARAGNVITESFTLDPEVAGVPVFVDSVTVDGNAATIHHGLGDHYTATYTVQSNDVNTLAGIEIVTHDEAGNIASLTLEGDVTVDTIAPTVTVDASTETSNNANSNLLAKAGDVITGTFTSTDIVSGVTIDGQNATVVNNGGNNYTATYTVHSGIHQGSADIVVNSTDMAGNVTVRSSVGAVTVDTIAPDVGIITPPVGVISTQGQTLVGYGERGTPIQIFENGRLLYTDTVDSNGRWSQVLTLDTRGPNTLTITDTDPTGNIGVAILPYDVVPWHGLEAERALQTTVVRGSSQAVFQDLLSGVLDEDATSPTFALTNLTFSVNGGAASASVPTGMTLVGASLSINPNSAAFAGVSAGHPETIVAHYTISDGHGGKLAQTDTITIESPAGDPAVVYDHAPTVAAALHTTVERGGQPLFEQLLAGAADLDGNALNVQNVTYSINGAAASATVPAGIQIAGNQILVNPNDAAFAGIASGHSETIVVAYTIADGFGGTVAQTDTVTVLGPPAAPANHAPTVQGALNTTAMVGLQAVWGRLLDGASDADAGNVLHVQDATFSINGGAASATVPGGIQIANDQILVDPNNAAFAGIASGQHETIVVHYNISDGHGGLTAQTDTVTIDGPAPNPAVVANHAPTVAEALAASVTRGGWAQWVQLLAGASDLDNNYLHATNLTYSVNGGAASATIPTGLQFVNDQLYVDPNNAAFAGLGSGQSATIVVHYNVTDGVGGSVAQSDTITILGQAADHATHDHAPTVAEALSTTVVAGQQGILNSLLAGATDVDGDFLSVANVTYSVNGGAFTANAPSGVSSLGGGFVQVLGMDPSFASLGAGQSETIVLHYNITDGRGGSVAQSETITVVGPAGPAVAVNHAPTVAAALTDILTVGQQGAMENLLAGALDADGNALHATNVTYSVNGGAASATVPGGVTVYPDQLLVDPNNAAFAGLATGQHETILVSYNVNDGHGGLTAQTDTITVQGPLAAAAAADVTPPVLTGAVSMTTMVGGAPVLPASLLEGAYDADGDVLHTANVTYSVNGGAASAVAPAGVTVSADQVQVDTANAAFAGLATGQHETVTLGYDVLDTHGNSVHQTATVTVNGPAASPALSHDHAPSVAAALTTEAMVGTSTTTLTYLLEGASDADANTIHVANVTFSVNGGAYSATAPAGITVNGDMLGVAQNDPAFAGLGAGQSETIVARYNIVDGIGGSTVQTDTITIEGPTNRHYLDLSGQTVTSTGHSDVFVASVLDGTPTSAGGNVDTILNFNAGAGDRIDLSGLLSSTTSVHSTVSINAFNSDSSMISVSVAGTEYYIAKVAGVDLSVPQAVGDLSTLKGASWTDTIDVTSAHGGPTTVTMAAGAHATGVVANAGGDWTMQIVSGTATEDAANHQLVFSTPSSGNEVIIHTADGLNHDLTNVTSVVWHA